MANGGSAVSTFTWNTTRLSYGNYSLTAVTNPVTNETNTTNNNFTSWITVTFPGDIDDDFMVNLQDLVLLAHAYGSTPSTQSVPPWGWNPNADIDGNGVVGLSDLAILAGNFEKQ